MDCSPPGSSVHRIFQARILEWIAVSFSRSSLPRNWTQVSCIAGRFFTDWAMREAIWVDRKKHSLMILILELTNPQRSWEGSLEFLYQDHFPILNILEDVNYNDVFVTVNEPMPHCPYVKFTVLISLVFTNCPAPGSNVTWSHVILWGSSALGQFLGPENHS